MGKVWSTFIGALGAFLIAGPIIPADDAAPTQFALGILLLALPAALILRKRYV